MPLEVTTPSPLSYMYFAVSVIALSLNFRLGRSGYPIHTKAFHSNRDDKTTYVQGAQRYLKEMKKNEIR